MQFIKTYKIGREQLIIFTTTVLATLATDLLVGVALGIAMKIILHLMNGTPLKSIFKAKAEYKEIDAEHAVLTITSPALFSNYLSIKPYLDRIPLGKNLILDFTEVAMIDHTFMEHIHIFTHEYEHTEGGHVTLLGMDEMTKSSKHPLASRKQTVVHN